MPASAAAPALAAKVVNAIVDAYMKMQQQAKVDQTRSASAYLANEIKQLRQTVQEADAKVDQFRASANLYIGNNQTSLNTQQLGELTTQLATVRAQKADLEALLLAFWSQRLGLSEEKLSAAIERL